MLFFCAGDRFFCNAEIAFSRLVARLSGISKPRRPPQPERTTAKSDGSKVQVSPALFVCIFTSVFERVFRGQKKGLRYFKIQGTYFKKQGTYFFFAPTWGLRTENQFSIFRTGKRRFSTPVLLPRMSVLSQRGASRENNGLHGRRGVARGRLNAATGKTKEN